MQRVESLWLCLSWLSRVDPMIKGQRAIVVTPGISGAYPQLMPCRAYGGRGIICCIETLHGGGSGGDGSAVIPLSADTAPFPETDNRPVALPTRELFSQVVTISQRSAAKCSLSTLWKGIDLVSRDRKGWGLRWRNRHTGSGTDTSVVQAGLLQAGDHVSPPAPVFWWSSSSSIVCGEAWHWPLRTLSKMKRLSVAIVSVHLSSV